MQIGGISSLSFSASIAPAQRPAGTDLLAGTAGNGAGKPAAAATAGAAPGVAASSSSVVAGKAVPAAAATRAASGAHGSGGGQAPTQGASGTVAEETLAAVYSTTVGGKSYSGSVTESAGEYTASVPNLPGATASGSSVEAAENSLSLVIDTLV